MTYPYRTPRIASGLSVFLHSHAYDYLGKPIGLLANQASVEPDLQHALLSLDIKLPGSVKKIFSPQHGFVGEKQDNMVESDHGQLPDGRPVYSLYSERRAPKAEWLSDLDVLLVDLQDAGTRVYTFVWTVVLTMEVCAEIGLEVIILDRPNPIGGEAIEGNLLDDDCQSFVGLAPIPMRHSLTMGELCLYVNSRFKKPCNLTVIPMHGWQRDMYHFDTELTWVMPSPNLPLPTSALLYPGAVIWEGTNVSEGRGTTRPFHIFGAPYLDSRALALDLKPLKLPGFMAREASFQPTFNKWSGELCHGLEIYPQDKSFKPFLTALSILEIILRRWPNEFKLKEPPYEYEFERRPIDLILGRKGLFEALKSGTSAKELCASFSEELKRYRREIKTIKLY
ncbi:MAG: DUF1343 domain-containing protein [Deltaproteobacteria bacterium]|jgi:uncharacterized protein YbbC (DUF1343 family)|nr:DUF1343 domain-containing protein [Deltaproteobacteria bacterium]